MTVSAFRALREPKTVHRVLLFHCPELDAFVMPRQCRRSQDLPTSDDEGPAETCRSLCRSCPGAEALWEKESARRGCEGPR